MHQWTISTATSTVRSPQVLIRALLTGDSHYGRCTRGSDQTELEAKHAPEAPIGLFFFVSWPAFKLSLR